MKSYLLAVLAGVIVYLVMLLDSKYIEKTTDKNFISPKLPLLVTLIVWLICTFAYNDSCNCPIHHQYIKYKLPFEL